MKIAIDPGHGMSNKQPGVYDPGATHVENGQPFEEAAIALKYGLALRDICRSQNLDVFVTRDDADDHAPVRERARNAEQAGCDVFVSLHLNDVEDDSANGLEVLYGKQTCEALAKALQGTLIKTTGFKNRGAKLRGDLAVLKFKGRAALIELGFIGNDGDRTVLLNPLKREQICKSIVSVITK